MLMSKKAHTTRKIPLLALYAVEHALYEHKISLQELLREQKRIQKEYPKAAINYEVEVKELKEIVEELSEWLKTQSPNLVVNNKEY
jgi:seryl-tRNA synthetase